MTSVHLSECGRYLLTNSRDDSICLVDIRKIGGTNLNVIQRIDNEFYQNTHDTNPARLNYSGKYAAVGGRQGRVLIFDMDKGILEKILED